VRGFPLPSSPYLVLLTFALLLALRAEGQSAANADSYQLEVSVDEVILSFHAADALGSPVNDLKLSDLDLLDNGKPPRKVLTFDSMPDLPIRAGILMDTSESMTGQVGANRVIAELFAQRVLRQRTDQAFVMEVGYISKLRQDWSNDPALLRSAVRSVRAGGANPLGGTSIFDNLFKSCFYQFGKIEHAASGNFILLFSDGEDNASHTSLSEAVDACQHADTAIYVFRSPPTPDSPGPRTLAELASQTGGRVFRVDDTDARIYGDLRMIESDLRSQYRIVYKPAELRRDGSFHEIELVGPDRVKSIHVRSGYYAPKH
jgi:Ca-activated chloride channel family protein